MGCDVLHQLTPLDVNSRINNLYRIVIKLDTISLNDYPTSRIQEQQLSQSWGMKLIYSLLLSTDRFRWLDTWHWAKCFSLSSMGSQCSLVARTLILSAKKSKGLCSNFSLSKFERRFNTKILNGVVLKCYQTVF